MLPLDINTSCRSRSTLILLLLYQLRDVSNCAIFSSESRSGEDMMRNVQVKNRHFKRWCQEMHETNKQASEEKNS
jgi:hypothetical protein